MEKLVKIEGLIKELQKNVTDKLTLRFKFAQGIENGERTDIDDSNWKEKNVLHWSTKNGVAYLRNVFTVPENVEGIGIESSVILRSLFSLLRV